MSWETFAKTTLTLALLAHVCPVRAAAAGALPPSPAAVARGQVVAMPPSEELPDTAKIATTQADARRIVLSLTCAADPVFYDHPLTVVCTVPAGWRTCRVTQGRASSRVESKNRTVMFDALPGPTPIAISPSL